MRARQAWLKGGLVGLTALVLGAGLAERAPAREAADAAHSLPAVTLQSLPPEAQTTYKLIHEGGPFPYGKDGTVFLNRERLLPPHSRGYYREYTVKTPRSKDRGPRRIICGGKPPTAPEACYYTADHYASFSRITTP